VIELAFPPAFILILAALLIAVARPALRPAIVLLAPLVTLWAIWRLPDGVLLTTQFLGYRSSSWSRGSCSGCSPPCSP